VLFGMDAKITSKSRLKLSTLQRGE
jgi:hypothetical protein